jgi:hypothetical protein
LTTLRTFGRTDRKKDEVDKPGPARTLSGSRSGRAALRREQREPSHGEKGEIDHRRHKHRCQKIRNGVTKEGAVWRIDTFQGSDRKTNKETTLDARQHILIGKNRLPLLGNGSINTFPRQRIFMQQ